jgi:cation:H+ antiporter
MLMLTLVLIGSFALLIVGAEGLVRGSAAVARRLGVQPLLIGLTIVALGTSSPELIVSVGAAATGNGNIGLGNALGSNISNLLLILGAAALVRPIHVRPELLRREVPVLIAATVLVIALLYDRVLSRVDGAVLLLGGIGWLAAEFLSARREYRASSADSALLRSGPAPRAVWVEMLWLLGGLAALLVGARYLLGGSVVMAERLGFSEMAIGLTVVAIGTSLPELATSMVAARRRQDDVAIGNAVGSNIINVLVVLGVTALINPIEIQGLRFFDIATLLGSVLLIVPLLRTGGRISRFEGVILLAAYATYLFSMATSAP